MINEETIDTIYDEGYVDWLKEAAAEILRLRAENEKLMTMNEKQMRRIHLFKNTRNEQVFEKLMKAHEKIERLEKYEKLVRFIANDYYELSHDKVKWQHNDWYKRCRKLIEEDNEQDDR